MPKRNRIRKIRNHRQRSRKRQEDNHPDHEKVKKVSRQERLLGLARTGAEVANECSGLDTRRT